MFLSVVDDGLDGDMGEALARDELQFQNYAGLEADEGVYAELIAFEGKVYLLRHRLPSL